MVAWILLCCGAVLSSIPASTHQMSVAPPLASFITTKHVSGQCQSPSGVKWSLVETHWARCPLSTLPPKDHSQDPDAVSSSSSGCPCGPGGNLGRGGGRGGGAPRAGRAGCEKGEGSGPAEPLAESHRQVFFAFQTLGYIRKWGQGQQACGRPPHEGQQPSRQ